MSVVSFNGIALENIPAGAAVQIELDTESGTMRVRALRVEDLRAAVAEQVAEMLPPGSSD